MSCWCGRPGSRIEGHRSAATCLRLRPRVKLREPVGCAGGVNGRRATRTPDGFFFLPTDAEPERHCSPSHYPVEVESILRPPSLLAGTARRADPSLLPSSVGEELFASTVFKSSITRLRATE